MHAMKGIIILMLVLTNSISWAAKDESGSKEHNLIGRYDDFYITEYQYSEYDEAEIIVSLYDKDKENTDLLKLEGKVTNIQYSNPKKETITSSLQVFEYYEKLLTTANAEFLLNCRNEACFVNEAADQGVFINNWVNNRKILMKGFLADIDSDFGLLTAKITNADGKTIHVFLAISARTDNTQHYVSMSIIESAVLDTDKIHVITVDDSPK